MSISSNDQVFSDKELERYRKQVSRAIGLGKPDTSINHYKSKLANRAAQIIVLIPAEQHILLLWDETTNAFLSKERQAWNKKCKILREDAEYDATLAGFEFCIIN